MRHSALAVLLLSPLLAWTAEQADAGALGADSRPSAPSAIVGIDTPGLEKPERHCETQGPRADLRGTVVVDYTVQADGSLADLRLLKAIPSVLGEVVVEWLKRCRFAPGKLAGKPVAVRDLQVFRFGISDSAPRPMPLGKEMSRPVPNGQCGKPQMPIEAREKGITGLVLIEFVVHVDGHVDEIVLKNKNAPRILFEAVRDWLQQCRFTPSILAATGEAVPVKLIMPFNFSTRWR